MSSNIKGFTSGSETSAPALVRPKGRLAYAAELPLCIIRGIGVQVAQTLRATMSLATLGFYEFKWRDWDDRALLSETFICFMSILRPKDLLPKNQIGMVRNPSDELWDRIFPAIKGEVSKGNTCLARCYSLAALVGLAVVHAFEALEACLTVPAAVLTWGYFPSLNLIAETSLRTFSTSVEDVLLLALVFFRSGLSRNY